MRLLKYAGVGCLIALFFSCKKNSDTVALTPNFYLIDGGVADSANTLLLFSSSDTVTFNVVISSTYYLSSNALVSLGVADDYRTSYNTTYGTNYQAMPANAYSFRDTITNIAANFSLYDTIPVTIFKHALSTDQKYLLPIKILSAGNYKVDSASSIIYLRTVNSALSGIYNSFVTKTMYNGDAADSSISSIDTFTIVKALIPSSTILSQLDYADLGINGWKYILGFTVDDNLFYASANDVIFNSVQPNSFKTITATYNPTNKDIYIKSSYKNISGDERIVEESLTLH